MALQDILGFSFFAAFGLWLVVFPGSAIRFYTAFHGGAVRLPTTTGFRIAGGLWLALLAVFTV